MADSKLNEQIRALLNQDVRSPGISQELQLEPNGYSFPPTAPVGPVVAGPPGPNTPGVNPYPVLEAPNVNTFSITPSSIVDGVEVYGELITPTDGSDRATVTINIQLNDVPLARGYKVYMVAS